MSEIELKSNEFWGLRSGVWSPKTNKRGEVYGFTFKGKRASTTKRENQGGVGRKGRKTKKYANRKLNRLNRG